MELLPLVLVQVVAQEAHALPLRQPPSSLVAFPPVDTWEIEAVAEL